MEPKEKEKTEQELANTFVAEYQALCKQHGMQLVANPVYLKRDDGTFSLVIQYQVEKIKE
jgi:predicted restriction endonuclease